MVSILVTGGAGYIGSHVCKLLAENGVKPIALDNLARGDEAVARWGTLEVGDISDVDWVRTVIRRHEPVAIIHCAAYTSATESLVHPAVYYCSNVIGTLSLLNAMIAENLRQLVFCSGSAVYGAPDSVPVREEDPVRPTTPFGRSLSMMEQVIADYADAYGMRHVTLRAFEVAGADPSGETGELHDPETHDVPLLVKAAMENRPFKVRGVDYPTADGTAVRDYIHVSDLAEIHLLGLRYLDEGNPSCVLNAGTGTGTSIRELSEALEGLSGRRIVMEASARQPGEPAEMVADVSRLKSLLRHTPTLSALKTILETSYRWQADRARSKAA